MNPIHASGINTFMKCQRRWVFSDVDWGMGYRKPIEDSDALLLGTWTHQALYDYYFLGVPLLQAYDNAANKTINNYQSLNVLDSIDIVPTNIQETYQLGKAMLHGYSNWIRRNNSLYSDRELIFLHGEQTFEVVIKGVTLRGTWDGIVKQALGGLWVFETKTTSNADQLKAGLEFDWQPRLYTLAAREMFGEDVQGVIYNIIVKNNPVDVKILKNGLPSRAQTELNSTTYELYKQVLDSCIKETGKDPEQVYSEYDIALDYLKVQRPELQFYQRHVVIIPEAQVEATKNMLPHLYSAMDYAANLETAIPRLERFTCGYCPYRWPCQIVDDGKDPIELLETSFIQVKRDEDLSLTID